MASKRKPPQRSSQRGSTLYGVLAGLLIGLVVAAGVAFYVTQAPMPFVDKATRQAEQTQPTPDPRLAPDPNGGLYGRDGPAGTAPTGPTATAPAPLPGVTAAPPSLASANPNAKPAAGSDELGALIASLPPKSEPAPVASASSKANAPAAAKPAPAPAHASAAPTAAPAHAAATPAPAASAATGTYFLQAGAYRVQDDAESLKARIILLGLPVAVQRAEVNNVQVNRVRVGPFARLDDMNRARSRLGENKIESAVVRQ
jgi:cell division protein FtsN